MLEAAQALLQLGPQAFLLKDGTQHWFAHPYIESKNLHGTGCTLSAAITAFLSWNINLLDVMQLAIEFIEQAIINTQDLSIGAGHGSIGHFNLAAFDYYRRLL
ncbi:hypothetical protein ACTFIZ_002953 [Dictyostelium cf. discoideum]